MTEKDTNEGASFPAGGTPLFKGNTTSTATAMPPGGQPLFTQPHEVADVKAPEAPPLYHSLSNPQGVPQKPSQASDKGIVAGVKRGVSAFNPVDMIPEPPPVMNAAKTPDQKVAESNAIMQDQFAHPFRMMANAIPIVGPSIADFMTRAPHDLSGALAEAGTKGVIGGLLGKAYGAYENYRNTPTAAETATAQAADFRQRQAQLRQNADLAINQDPLAGSTKKNTPGPAPRNLVNEKFLEDVRSQREAADNAKATQEGRERQRQLAQSDQNRVEAKNEPAGEPQKPNPPPTNIVRERELEQIRQEGEAARKAKETKEGQERQRRTANQPINNPNDRTPLRSLPRKPAAAPTNPNTAALEGLRQQNLPGFIEKFKGIVPESWLNDIANGGPVNGGK